MAARRTIKEAEPRQLELVKLPRAQLNQQISDEVASILILKRQRQKALGTAKALLNDINEKIDNIEKWSAQTCGPRLKEQLDQLMAELAAEGADEDSDEYDDADALRGEVTEEEE